MSDLSDIVQISISRETQAVARAAFGTPAIISEFSTSKTVVTFDRHRYYSKLTEMTDDGWTSFDAEYKAAQKIFSQNPKPSKVMIGRKDSGDASLTAALDAIQIATQDWYAFTVINTKVAKVVFDADFVASNSIVFTINGVAVTAVPFNTDQQTTMGDLETQIEADIANSTVTISGAPYREMTIAITDTTPSSISIQITGGASQPGSTISYDDTGVEQAFKDAAAWAETQKKIYFFSASDAGIYGSGSADIVSFMKSQNYDRTVPIYHTSAQVDQIPSWIETAWMGESLPYDPGSQTWAYKTLAGVTAYGLTSSQRTNILGKNGNIYTTTAGVDITEEGKVASGEWIDVIRGIDWVESRLQEEIFTELVNSRKIPYTDDGVTVIAGIVEGVLNEAARQGILVADSIVVTVPAVANVSPTDKANRLLPDVEFTATLQGAIQKVTIAGTVTV